MPRSPGKNLSLGQFQEKKIPNVPNHAKIVQNEKNINYFKPKNLGNAIRINKYIDINKYVKNKIMFLINIYFNLDKYIDNLYIKFTGGKKYRHNMRIII